MKDTQRVFPAVMAAAVMAVQPRRTKGWGFGDFQSLNPNPNEHRIRLLKLHT